MGKVLKYMALFTCSGILHIVLGFFSILMGGFKSAYFIEKMNMYSMAIAGSFPLPQFIFYENLCIYYYICVPLHLDEYG